MIIGFIIDISIRVKKMKYNVALAISEETSDEVAKRLPEYGSYSHYTSEWSLEAILKSGYLMGNKYFTNKNSIGKHKKFGFDDAPYELCIVRNTVMKGWDPNRLSGSSGNNRFLLNIDAITKVIRGVKKPYSIAEIPLENDYYKSRDAKELYDEYGVDLSEYFKKKPMITPKELREKTESRFRSMINKNRHFRNILNSMIINYEHVYDRISKREGEERIDLSKAKHIPINSKFMKLEICDKTLDNEEIMKLVRNLYKKDKNLFVMTDKLKNKLKVD